MRVVPAGHFHNASLSSVRSPGRLKTNQYILTFHLGYREEQTDRTLGLPCGVGRWIIVYTGPDNIRLDLTSSPHLNTGYLLLLMIPSPGSDINVKLTNHFSGRRFVWRSLLVSTKVWTMSSSGPRLATLGKSSTKLRSDPCPPAHRQIQVSGLGVSTLTFLTHDHDKDAVQALPILADRTGCHLTIWHSPHPWSWSNWPLNTDSNRRADSAEISIAKEQQYVLVRNVWVIGE